MELNIGPYIVKQRTEYSKAQLFDKETNENITDLFPHLAEKIIADYNEQKNNPEEYFKIDDGILIEIVGDIENLFIPDDVRFITSSVFSKISSKQIYLPPSITYIDANAFGGCNSLEYIEVPDSVTNIGSGAFRNCINLKRIKLPASLDCISDSMFDGCASLETIDLPDGVLDIRSYAFARCEKLKNVKLPKRLKALRSSVFLNCGKIEKIDLPNELTKINTDCFYGCASLKKIIIPDSVTLLGDRVFYCCTSLEYVKLPNTLKTLCHHIFAGCGNLKNIILPDAIETIEPCVFYGTNHLTNINIPRNLKSIGANLFSFSAVNSLSINHNLKTLEVYSTLPLPGPITLGLDVLYESKIDKLIIDKSVKKITPELLGTCGKQISKIDFNGTEEEFEKLKKDNKAFFKKLVNLKEINLLSKPHNVLEKQARDEIIR